MVVLFFFGIPIFQLVDKNFTCVMRSSLSGPARRALDLTKVGGKD